jgi:hypothetical protein
MKQFKESTSESAAKTISNQYIITEIRSSAHQAAGTSAIFKDPRERKAKCRHVMLPNADNNHQCWTAGVAPALSLTNGRILPGTGSLDYIL